MTWREEKSKLKKELQDLEKSEPDSNKIAALKEKMKEIGPY